MAATSGTPNPDVSGVDRTLATALGERPFEFEFFQAVRLLEKLLPDRAPVGRFGSPQREVARFSAHPSVTFPASEIQSLEWQTGQPPTMTVNFMGLTGPLGVLPLYYTELVMARLRERDRSPRDFLDLFNHRILSLFYQAWEKYRFTIAYERGERDRFSHHLLDLIGLGTKGLENRQAVADDSLLFYAGLLALAPRSAAALEQILGDYFGVACAVEQFVGAWHGIDESSQCCFEEGSTDSEKLGSGAVVGDEIWDVQSRACIRLGPLTWGQYQSFLPGGTAHEPLRALARIFAGEDLDLEARLILKREEVPACELGAGEEAGARLGWSSWARTAPMGRDPADTVLRI